MRRKRSFDLSEVPLRTILWELVRRSARYVVAVLFWIFRAVAAIFAQDVGEHYQRGCTFLFILFPAAVVVAGIAHLVRPELWTMQTVLLLSFVWYALVGVLYTMHERAWR